MAYFIFINFKNSYFSLKFIFFIKNFIVDEKIFYKKNKFKGKVGIFEINKNKINHILNLYSAEGEDFKKIF